MMGDVRAWCNAKGHGIEAFPLPPVRIAELIALIEAGEVSHSTASQRLFPLMLDRPDVAPRHLAEAGDLLQQRDDGAVEAAMREAMQRYPDKVEAYRKGNKGLLGLFMGEVMKATKGKADPRQANAVVRDLLENGTNT